MPRPLSFLLANEQIACYESGATYGNRRDPDPQTTLAAAFQIDAVANPQEQIVHIASGLPGQGQIAGAAIQNRIVRVAYGIVGHFRIHIFLCRRDGRRVADPVHIAARDLRIAEEVDEQLCLVLVLAAFGDAHGIGEQVEALILRQIECQVLVLAGHGQVVTGVVRRDPGFLIFHQVEHLVQ